jgi:ribosomal protein S12 methylthiotransferase accessory factor
MDRPRLKAHFRVVVSAQEVFLTAEDRHYLVTGPGAAAVLPYLDGRHTVADIAVSLSGVVGPADVLRAVGKYAAHGTLAEGRPDLPEAVLAYWDALGVGDAGQLAALSSAAVTVLSIGQADGGPVADALNQVGLRARAVRADRPADSGTGPHADLAEVSRSAVTGGGLLVVATDDYLRPELAVINEAMLAAGGRWALTKPTGQEPWLGPLFEPGQTGCWDCLRHRLNGNMQVERYLLGSFGQSVPFSEHPPGTAAGIGAAAGLLAGEVARIAAGGDDPALYGKMTTLNLLTLQTREHLLTRRPQCHACGDPKLMSGRRPEVVIESGAASHQTPGGLRAEELAVTYERLSRHVSTYLGAVTSVYGYGATHNGLVHTYSAGHNFAMISHNVNMLRRNLRGQSGGKGKSELQAKVSALCEGIERYAAVYDGDEPVILAAFSELGHDRAIHPAELLMFSSAQYEHRREWNRDPAHRLQAVPEPFDSDAPVDWTPAWSLTHQRERLVPAAYAWYGHPDVDKHVYCFADSNGTAAGSCPEEAIVQGFCELAERDSVALWWYNRARRPGVDLDSLGDPYIGALRELYASLGRSLWMLDITSDLGVPAFAAVSHRIGQPAEDIVLGFGAHLDPRIGAMRALTEVNQFLPAVEQQNADGSTDYADDDVATVAWWRGAKIAQEPWLRPDDRVPARRLGDFPAYEGDDMAGAVEACLRAATSVGSEMVVLDQSRPDLDLSVMRVLAPGLRHFWRRLAPGRLYDAPVRLGWLDAPTPEDKFNHWNVFF